MTTDAQIEQTITAIWGGKPDNGELVTIDEVTERLTRQGETVDRSALAEQMKHIANIRRWQVTEGFGNNVQVLPR